MKPIATVIIPIYKPNKKILKKLRDFLKRMKDIEVIELDGKGGLARTYNRGIKDAKTDIVVTLHQDCLPLETDFISKLIEPFEDTRVVMTYSWIKDMETGKKYLPHPPDGKLVAYRKKAVEDIGLFNEKIFFTGGEDVDIYLKLKKLGKIVSVNTTIIHNHEGYLGNRTVEKRKQNGSINGCLTRIWGFRNPFWWKAIIMSLRYPTTYGLNFTKAFIKRKQEYRRI